MILNLILRIVRALAYPFASLHRWTEQKIEQRRRRAIEQLFPVGCKVRALSTCPCARAVRGEIGTVRYMVDNYDEFRVEFAGGRGEIICPKGMERVK